ncbi:DNA-binding MarR family transcriptional regulator [Kribbella voronezhensis]|uniref:DNA-binding MarR family transcriptional regulator n=1 Tax=Kribbella voronezhensis TaxID=2512212 RepID=A0A4R7SV75_9ACTN|nr:MarR family transcriptional regulator [Kribbella voronezhensis]TDU83192.1 DNA-binding MarR family transcriptional regulator [Kribbella voronezhensis]
MKQTLGAASGLVRLTFLVQNLYAEVGRGCDLTVAQAQMLCALTEESLGMADLSGVLGLERSSLTGLVDRAEHRGLVVREGDARDRRVVKVTLTAAGADAVHKFHHQLTERLDQLLQDLPTSERERFARSLGRLVADVPAVFTD